MPFGEMEGDASDENVAFKRRRSAATRPSCARHNFPKQFLHYHRAGHGLVTNLKLSSVQGASGILIDTMPFGEMEGDAPDENVAFKLQSDEAYGPYYHQNILGGKALPFPTLLGSAGRSNASLMKEATPDIPGGLDATDGGPVVGTIIKPKFDLQTEPLGEAFNAFRQGGNFSKEPVSEAVRRAT